MISVTEQLDDSPESVILESVIEGMAEYYSKNLARETLKGSERKRYKAIHKVGCHHWDMMLIQKRSIS